MARVELRPSGKYSYAVVVEDVQDTQGRWRKRIIRSFGNAQKSNNLQKAHQFAAAVNMGRSYLAADIEVNKEDLQKALGIVVGTAIAVGALAWLFRERREEGEGEDVGSSSSQ